MRPERVLPWLLGGAIGAAGIFHGHHLRTFAATQTAAPPAASSRIAELENEVAILKRENESLRSLSQGGGEVAAPPELSAYVQKELELDFKSSPQVHRLAAEELRDRIAAAIEERYGPDGMDFRQQAWTLMGLLGPDDRFSGQLAAMKSIGARSWFDPASGEAWVTDRYDAQSIPDQAAMIRALALILMHQHYPPPPGWPGDEPAMARDAIHEGAARRLENQFLAREALHSGFTGATAETADRELLANLPRFVKGSATFGATQGTTYVEKLTTPKDLHRALHQPPTTTAPFVVPARGAAADPIALPGTTGDMMLEESMGTLGLQLWLDEADAVLALDCNGDRYRLYALDDTTVNLVWEIRFASEAAAGNFQAAADKIVTELAKTPAMQGRKVHLDRSGPLTLRLVNQVE